MHRFLIGLLVLGVLGGCPGKQQKTSLATKQDNTLAFTEWLLKGQAAYRQKKWTEALVAYEKLIVLAPDSPAGYNNRGTVYQVQGNLVAAIADYTRSLQLNPQFAAAYHNRGTAYLAQGLVELAIDDWKKACKYGAVRTCDYLKVHHL